MYLLDTLYDITVALEIAYKKGEITASERGKLWMKKFQESIKKAEEAQRDYQN